MTMYHACFSLQHRKYLEETQAKQACVKSVTKARKCLRYNCYALSNTKYWRSVTLEIKPPVMMQLETSLKPTLQG